MLDNVIKFLKNTNELSTANTVLNTFSKYASKVNEYDNLARWYMEIKNYPLAIKYAEKALVNSASNEQMYACRANLSKLYNHINDPISSLRYSNINHKLNPADYDPLMEQVFSHFLLNQKDKSEAILRDLITHNDLPEELQHRIKFNLGTYDLYKGKFKEGLKGFLLEGKQLGIWKNITLPFKFWEGGVQPGKTLIIQAEGGIGDEIINFRFATKLKDLGMNPIWYTTRPDLIKIFTRHGIDVRSSLHNVPKDSLWTYSMSLPIYLDLEPKDLWNGQYLFPLDAYIEKWRSTFTAAPTGNLKVGIRWTGNPEYEHDLHRSVPLIELYKTIEPFKYTLYSLQRDTGSNDIYEYPEITKRIYDLQYQLDHIDETLAVIHHLDIVITSCTSIAHMAAAMNKKVFVLVPISAYYTWASTTDISSIWYSDSVKVLRQTEHKSWEEPLKQLSKMLEMI